IPPRECGPGAWALLPRSSADAKALRKMLRPMNEAGGNWYAKPSYPLHNLPQWAPAWHALYAGRLVADDIEALASDLEKTAGTLGSSGGRAVSGPPSSKPGPFELEGGIPYDVGGLLGSH